MSEILEKRHCLQLLYTHSECHCFPRLCLLLRQPSDIPVGDPRPVRRSRLWGGSGSSSPMAHTCHRNVRGGRGFYLPPESLSCPARSGARSEYGGWYTLTPYPHRPPLDTPPNRLTKGRIHYIYWGTVWRVVSFTEGASIYRAITGGGLPVIPPPTPTHILDTKIYPAAAPERMEPYPSSAAYVLPPSACR